MPTPFTRRQFLRRAVLAAAGACAAPALTRRVRAAAPGETLLHASFGTTGMAAADIERLAAHPALRLVAVADVDLGRAETVKKKFPDVRIYQDWRELLDKEKAVESVNVTVPDHMHAAIAMSALQSGKHVYCQKPLTHDIYETRRLTEFARSGKKVTQMGIQIHSTGVYQQAVRIIQQGAIGPIKEVHAWSEKKWGDAGPRPETGDPVPADFNWDAWLGIAATRPFLGHGYYHPGNWRKRLDFGTGTFGDMGCHIYDPVFSALQLTAPISVRSEGPAPNSWNWATDSIVHYVFPATPYTAGPTVSVTWYDGNERPPKDVQALLEGDKLPGEGSIFVGAKGAMLLPHYDHAQLYPDKDFAGFQRPHVEEQDHWRQFVEACLGRGRASAGFDYAGPLTEAVLLGSVACRFPQTTLQWNARELKFDNLSEANQHLRRPYRPGWTVQGLS
ncbi:MAG TPA: Gfo/Idh/MocA family oxidoreductase [Candidatus Acidoferrum sp.]|nr:Gfo/Idh/MocA family oxidoreductase [Candidatus Acidoferrum sp.]